MIGKYMRGLQLRIINDDCLNVLPTLESDSVDSIVTDPPYELGFLGKHWDNTGIAYNVAMWQECLRVLKPGGHLLAFGGTRTYHRMAMAIEDAGFEVRDMIEWVYGSGFPKSLDISKGLDKIDANDTQTARRYRFTEWVRSQGVTAKQINEATGTNMGSHYTTDLTQPAIMTPEHLEACRHLFKNIPEWVETEAKKRGVESEQFKKREVIGESFSSLGGTVAAGERNQDYINEHKNKIYKITKPHTPEAKQWEGWGTALKPSHEPICLARKPLSEKTIVENVLKHGTGGINIDGCRVETKENTGRQQGKNKQTSTPNAPNNGFISTLHTAGRFPANLIHDGSDEVKECFPEATSGSGYKQTQCGGIFPKKATDKYIQGDSGNASRYFKSIIYTSKASPSERLECNRHPTVKPIKLIEYLVTMITPPNGVVLDPFLGSGTTAIACRNLGFDCIGIEKETEYMEIINVRLEHYGEPEPSLFEVKNDSNPS